MKRFRKWTTFDYVNVLLTILMMCIMLYPMLYATAGAFNDGNDYMRGGIYLFPREFTLDNFRVLFRDSRVLDAYKISAGKAILGSISQLFITSLVAYGITRPGLMFKKVYLFIIMFTMFFGGGLIPYFLVIRDLGLYNTFWVYIIPGMFSTYNMLIMQSYIRELPASVVESCKIDGAGEYTIYARIILPMSKPVLAALCLFCAVGHWNSYFDSMMYTSSDSLQSIQYYLQKIITKVSAADELTARAMEQSMDMMKKPVAKTLKMATMVATALPILCIYPFLQKYFVKGITIGSVKG